MAKFDKKKDDTELLEEEQEQDSVIQEQIKPWHKRKFKKILSVIGFSLLAGIIFGIAARFVFRYSESFISRIFGLNETYEGVYPPPSGSVTLSPNQTVNSDKPEDNDVKIIQQEDKTSTGEGAAKDLVKTEDQTAVSTDSFRAAIEEMRRTAEGVRKSLVNISAITSVVNWLGENIDQTESTLGLIVTESPTDIYILTYYDKVQNADKIEVKFRSGNTYSVSMITRDDGYNVAVISLPKAVLKPNDIEDFSVIKIGNSDEIYSGMPIIGIGSFDGESWMTEYGYITSDAFTEYITDAAIGIFTTDLSYSGNGEGVVTDIDGKVVGIITRQLGSSIKINVNKCMRVNSLVKIAEKLCNGNDRVYFGILAENIPDWALRENNIESGIYVNSVEPSSPASDAGIRRGDFIISVNGQQIDDVDAFSDILMQAAENSVMEIELYRSSKSADQRFSVSVRPVNRNS
ncbi:MAG: PDZ domain-containing protein [Lachnospiraceae bacterium]|nr:PDZ domain-containing protein [Lachnospiraceae bacterium]